MRSDRGWSPRAISAACAAIVVLEVAGSPLMWIGGRVYAAPGSLGLGAFLVWCYVTARAFILPFMPMQ